MEAVARQALGEVRLAVSGYRQPTLDGELAGARMALSAAGIAAEVERPEVALEPEVEAVLAWAVREGATNVIRHSGARRCTVRVAAGLTDASVEVIDDGRGAGAAMNGAGNGHGGNGHGGNGLAGLGERAQALRGRVEPGAGPAGGGFRLAVHVPSGGGGGAVIRVLIAEDQGMVRGALASLLALEPDIEVVAQVPRGDEVLAAVEAAAPDVALLDIEMPGATGLEAAERLRAARPGCRVLILTTFGRPGYLRRAMEGGASGFLLKDAPASELAAAIRRAMAGERIVDPGLAAAALSQGECPLTPREHEVLSASRQHATVAELATALYLSQGTVRNHLSSVMQKLDARNRGEAVKRAEEQGWL